jgi:hypothetical protein
MGKVLFTISYAIKPELRAEYLQFAKELRAHFTAAGKRDYAIFETKGKKNHFTEVFSFNSMEEYNALEEHQNDQTQELESRVERFLERGGMKYSTLVESEG